MAFDKQHILDEIKRVAKVNGGESPGIQRFKRETGIKKSDWYPDHWLRWGDALIEAGFSPNEMDTAWTSEALLEKYIDLIRKLRPFSIGGRGPSPIQEGPSLSKPYIVWAIRREK